MELCAKIFHSLKASTTVQLFKLATMMKLRSPFRCLIWLASNSKCDSESCYVRHDEDTSHSQRPEAATIGTLSKKGFLEISQNSQECASLFLNKVAGLRPATLLKKRVWHRHFPVDFAKFLRTPFLQNTPGHWTTASVLNVNLIQGFWLYLKITCKNQSKTRPKELVN